MRRQTIILALAAGLMAGLAAGSLAGAQEQLHSHTSAPHPAALASTAGVQEQGGGISLNVASLNNSGISGTVTLRPIGGDRIEVAIRADGAGAGPQPAHIHEGVCADLNPIPKIPLATVTNGGSTTEVDGSLQQLTSAPHVIFMHKSPQELPIFVACTDITVADRLATVPAAGEAGPWTDVAAGLSGFGLVLAVTGYALRRYAR